MATRAPVYHTLALVDPALFLVMQESGFDRLGVSWVHSEAGSRPIGRGAYFFQLAQDNVSVFFPPLPDAFQKFLAPQIMPSFSFFLYLLLDNILRGDSGMVSPGDPKRFISLHSFFAYQNILDRCVERVAHMQRPRHVRRGDGNSEGFLAFAWKFIRIKKPGIFPFFINLGLYRFRVVWL